MIILFLMKLVPVITKMQLTIEIVYIILYIISFFFINYFAIKERKYDGDYILTIMLSPFLSALAPVFIGTFIIGAIIMSVFYLLEYLICLNWKTIITKKNS